MGEQSIRQEARRAAIASRGRRRQQQAERDKRLDALVVEVVVALRERDAAEQRAASAVRAMITQGLTTAEVMAWCDGELSSRDLARLRQVSSPPPTPEEASAGRLATRPLPAPMVAPEAKFVIDGPGQDGALR